MSKKIIHALTFGFLIATALTSCKKDQECVCTTTLTDLSTTNPFPQQSASATTKFKDTKKNAKETCDGGNSSTTDASNETRKDVKCELK